MALFDFNKKNKENPPEISPADQVRMMQRQGMSSSEIVRQMQRLGYRPFEISSALNEVTIKTGAPLEPQIPQPEAETNIFSHPEQFSQQPASTPQNEGALSQPNTQAQQPMYSQAGNMPRQPLVEPQGSQDVQQDFAEPGKYEGELDSVEELVEAIVDEKWSELLKNINKIVEWKKHIESRMDVIEQRMHDLEESFKTLHMGVLEKINDYDKNIKDVGVEIKAMEKVFQKVLPTFTENVNELSRVAGKLRSGRKK